VGNTTSFFISNKILEDNSMTERKKVTLDDLIKRKIELKQERKYEGELFIPSLDGDIQIEVLKSDAIDFLESMKDAKTEKEYEKIAQTLVYSVVKEPNLTDKKLQKEFECEEPTDIVGYIFTDAEQADIMEFALKAVGMSRGVVKEVKN